MSVAMALFELLQLFLIFLDHPRIEYLWHVPIMPPINRKGITGVEPPEASGLPEREDRLPDQARLAARLSRPTAQESQRSDGSCVSPSSFNVPPRAIGP